MRHHAAACDLRTSYIHHGALQELDLRRVNIDMGFTDAMVKGMRSNTTLTSINLDSCTIRGVCCAKLVQMMKSTPTLRSMLVRSVHSVKLMGWACFHTYTHTSIHTYPHIHTHIRTCIHTYIHTCMHTYRQTYGHTDIHTYIHTYRHGCMPVQTPNLVTIHERSSA